MNKTGKRACKKNTSRCILQGLGICAPLAVLPFFAKNIPWKNPYTNMHLPSFSHDTGHKLLQVKKGGTMLHHLSGIHTWPVPAQTVDFLSNGKLVRGFLLLWNEMGKTGLFIIKRKGFDLCPRHFRTGERLHLPWKRKRLFLPRMGHRPNLRPHSPQSPNQTDFGKEVSPVATLNKDSWSNTKATTGFLL